MNKKKRSTDMGRSEDCNCGCNEDGQGEMTITLILEDDTGVECVMLTTFTVDERDYITLFPIEGGEVGEGEVYLYRYSKSEDGQPNLKNIEDGDGYEIMADAFDELLDSQECDELVDKDEVG